jgi:nucleoside-diphosphate-sugar epimerase
LIIGNGLIANSLRDIDNDAIIFFASGVSDSQCRDIREFRREADLLQANINVNEKRRFYYFSTCSVYDPTLELSPYVLHKSAMEELVLSSTNGCVIRLPNVVGQNGNANNLVNYIIRHIKTGTQFTIQNNAKRYLLGTSEMVKLIDVLVRESLNQRVINLVPPKKISVKRIVEIMEEHLESKAKVLFTAGGSSYEVSAIETNRLAEIGNIEFVENYPEILVQRFVKSEL